MPVLTSSISYLLDSRYNDVFFEHYARWATEFDAWHRVKSSDKNYEMEAEYAGLAAVSEVGEGENFPEDRPTQRYNKTYTHTKYGVITSVAFEAVEDGKFGVIDDTARAQARALDETVETDGAKWLNNAFSSAAAYLGPDSKALCATDHPAISGTWSNKLATDSDLATSSLWDAVYLMEETVDDAQKLLRLKPDLLIVSPEQEQTAKVILQSTQQAGTTNNDANVIRGRNLSLKIGHYLTDADAWFLADTGNCPLTWYWRKKPTGTTWMVEDNELKKYKIRARWSNGFLTGRGLVGTPGA